MTLVASSLTASCRVGGCVQGTKSSSRMFSSMQLRTTDLSTQTSLLLLRDWRRGRFMVPVASTSSPITSFTSRPGLEVVYVTWMTGENTATGKEIEDRSGQVMEATSQPSTEKKKLMGSLQLLGRSRTMKCSPSISMSI